MSRRFADALADFGRAAQCDKDNPKAAEWKGRAERAMQENKQARHERETALALARERFAVGELAEARVAIGHLSEDDPERRALEGAISQRDSEARALVDRAKKAHKDNDVRATVNYLREAARLSTNADGLAELQRQAIDRAVNLAAASFKEGRLDRCEQELSLLGEWSEAVAARADLDDALRLAREAARALADDRYARAGVLLGRLSQIGLKSGWIADVRKHLTSLDEHRKALLEGPLGMLSGAEVPSVLSLSGERPVLEETLPGAVPVARDMRPPVVDRHENGTLPKRLMLRIDGAGSFLLLRGDRVSVGRAGPGATADLQLVSDLSERHADIVRAGEDYFVASTSGVELAGHPVEHALLQDGDRVRVGKRVRLTFRRPSQKSPAAALDLGEGVRTTTDCRRVILWSGPLILGATRDCHIKLGASLGRAVLIERAGRLILRRLGQTDEVIPLAVGQQVECGDLRLSIHAWADDKGRVIG